MSLIVVSSKAGRLFDLRALSLVDDRNRDVLRRDCTESIAEAMAWDVARRPRADGNDW